LSRLNAAVKGEVEIRSDGLQMYADYIVLVMGDRATHLSVHKTTYSERFNLTVRMHCRRFARHTNANSKSLPHHKAAIALFVAWYNFCRLNSGSLDSDGNVVTPAVAAGLAGRQWTLAELLKNAAAAPQIEPEQIEPRESRKRLKNWAGVSY
jgi:hypothetical protein